MAATLFHGGTIWPGAGSADSRALLVRDGRIVALDDEAMRLAADNTAELIDLDGGFLMPSFGDGHAHPLFGGFEFEGPEVRAGNSVDEIIAIVKKYTEEHPEQEWIFGASYDGSLAESGLFDARWLDEAVSDRPVVLNAWDYHTIWVNSKALKLAGITAETPDPPLGQIPHREDGEPLGTLREWGAVDLISAVAPPREMDVRLRAVQRAGEYYLARGVTWVQDAWVTPDDIDTYLEAARRDLLPLRFNLAHYADPLRFFEQLPGMLDSRQRVDEIGSSLLTAHTVKFFADGVIENETGALLEPYCSALHKHGMSVWQDRTLHDAVQQADAQGFQVHIHAIGDAAVRQALDAIEHAIAVNGPRDRRPVIAHAQLVDEADLPRFQQLGVIACMQPLWAQLDALMNVLTVPRLGTERSKRQYQMHSIDASGATLSFGSDWPVSSGAPLDGIPIAVSRQTPEGDPVGGWTPEQAVTLDFAMNAYTSAVAVQAFADRAATPWGRLEPGLSADLVWLDRDPREMPTADIRAISVRATWLEGSPRYVS